MNRFGSLLIISLLFNPVSVHAQDAQQIRAELQAKLATLQGKEVELKNAESAILKREQSEQQRLKAHGANLAEFKTADARLVSEQERYHKESMEHMTRCAEIAAAAASGSAKCDKNKADSLTAWSNAINGRVNNLTTQLTAINTAAEALNADMKTTADRRARNKEQLESVRANIVVVQQLKAKLNLNDSFLNDPRARKKMGNDCLPLTEPEALKECIDGVFGESD